MAARLRALGRIVSGDVTKAAQTEDGMFALEWTRQGEAVLLKLDGRLQIVDRRSVFQGGPVDLDRLLLDRERNGHLTAHPVRSGRRRMARRWRWSGCRGSRIFLAKGGPA